jgi:DNA-binding NtrC family response regulator
VNCGALPENLLEAELFGVEKGAYTGAVKTRAGFLERAEGGTLFLDEVAELTPALQVKLLRVLETGDYSPLGSEESRHADVRILAATHRDLDKLVETGALRQDFLFRLDVVEVVLPPLRQRRSDIPLLAAHLLDSLAKKHGQRKKNLSPAATSLLGSHDFPGNVRELRNALERGVLLAEGEEIEPRHLPESLRRSPAPPPPPQENSAAEPGDPFAGASFRDAKAKTIEDFERRYLGQCLERAGGNISEAARLADMPYKNFHAKMQQLGLDPLAYKRRS